jgi:hypothetical protein
MGGPYSGMQRSRRRTSKDLLSHALLQFREGADLVAAIPAPNYAGVSSHFVERKMVVSACSAGKFNSHAAWVTMMSRCRPLTYAHAALSR